MTETAQLDASARAAADAKVTTAAKDSLSKKSSAKVSDIHKLATLSSSSSSCFDGRWFACRPVSSGGGPLLDMIQSVTWGLRMRGTWV